MNEQKPEKRWHGDAIAIHSMFATIQGEGPFTGTPAYFIRLAGCNIQCPHCDTDYTSTREMWNPRSMLSVIRESFPRGHLIVITGGEPFRQNFAPLVCSLLSEGYVVQIETNGTIDPPASFVDDTAINNAAIDDRFVIVCSPKGSQVKPGILHFMRKGSKSAFKYVLDHRAQDQQDGLPTAALGWTVWPRLARPPEYVKIYLQPMDHGNEDDNRRSRDACIQACMKHDYTLCLQTHKIIGVP